jgi:hypothetical protein
VSLRHLRLDEIVERGWRDPEVLEELHQERSWSATDIARRFDVEQDRVMDALEAHDLYVGGSTHAPKSGLARELWLRGTTPDAGGDSS